MAQPSYPKSITGGCLCGKVRYRIEFAPDHDWKHGPHTCQCTQCRKNCGSLIYNFHTVLASEITFLTPSPSTSTTISESVPAIPYAEFNSSPHCYRLFCASCGSPLGWRDDRDAPAQIEMAVGGFDEAFLIGERVGEGKPHGGFGEVLASPKGDHFHVRNEIPGVTERLSGEGTRFWKGSKEGPLLKEKIGGGV